MIFAPIIKLVICLTVTRLYYQFSLFLFSVANLFETNKTYHYYIYIELLVVHDNGPHLVHQNV